MKRLFASLIVTLFVACVIKIHAESVQKGGIVTLSIGNVNYNHINIPPAWAIETPDILELVGGQGTTSVRIKGLAPGTGRVFCFYATEKYDSDLKMWIVDEHPTKYFTVTVVDNGGSGESGGSSGSESTITVNHDITLYVGEEYDCYITFPPEVEDYYGRVERYYQNDSQCKASWSYDSDYLERIAWKTDMSYYGFKTLKQTSSPTYIEANYATRKLDNMGRTKYTNRKERWAINILPLEVTPESITLDREIIDLNYGESAYIEATMLPTGAPQHFIWRNYDSDIVSIMSPYQVWGGNNYSGIPEIYTQNGGIYIVANDEMPGEATIKVKSNFPKVYSKTIVVRVNKKSDPSSEAISFADDKVKSICVENWDTDCDGELSLSEASEVSSLGTVFSFSKISSFNELRFFSSLKSIEEESFFSCKSLTSITIPNSVTSIGSHAFYNCYGLNSIEIPNSVTTIGSSAFGGCTGLTSMTVESRNTTYDSRDNCNAIIETSTNTLIAGCKNSTILNSVTSIGNYAFSSCTGLTSVTIPNSVTNIGEGALFGCTALTSIEIPNSVTNIGKGAFFECTGLTSIEIPNSVTSIGERVFYGCNNLTTITIPNSVTSIGEATFRYCTGLTSVTIPESVTNIGEGAFSDCTGLTSVISKIQQPFEITIYEFANWDDETNSPLFSTATLYVPFGTKSTYEATYAWNQFQNIVEMEDISTDIRSTCNKLTEQTEIYNLQGHRLDSPKKGLNIIRMSDGTTKKIVVK